MADRANDPTSADQRFDKVRAALLQLRQCYESGFTRLDAKMDAGFSRIERQLDQFIDAQIQTNELVDRRLRARE
jgi:hypothetical protein